MMVRVALAADVARVSEIARAAYAPYVERLGFEPPPMVADFAAAERAGELRVIGEPVIGYVVFREREADVLLENVAVAPRETGRGLGRRLVAHVERAAASLGKPVVLYTNAAMTENVALYPRLGYRETHRRVENGLSRVYFRKGVCQ